MRQGGSGGDRMTPSSGVYLRRLSSCSADRSPDAVKNTGESAVRIMKPA